MHWNKIQGAQGAGNAKAMSLASGRNGDASDTRYFFADEATLLLHSLGPVGTEFHHNARKHPVLPGLPGHSLPLLTRHRVVLAPWLRFYSLPYHDGAGFTLPLPRALTYFSFHLYHWPASAPQFRIPHVQGKLARSINS